MPLPKPVLLKYKNPVFVETGTLFGEAVKLALDCGFKEIYSIDIEKSIIDDHKKTFSNKPNVHFYCGSSNVLLNGILRGIHERVTFWLDAHPPGNILTLDNTPILGELHAIEFFIRQITDAQLPTIMLDDMRLFSKEDRAAVENILRRMYDGVLLYEDTHIAAKDIMVYKPHNSSDLEAPNAVY